MRSWVVKRTYESWGGPFLAGNGSKVVFVVEAETAFQALAMTEGPPGLSEPDEIHVEQVRHMVLPSQV